jgi:hypothetical protein
MKPARQPKSTNKAPIKRKPARRPEPPWVFPREMPSVDERPEVKALLRNLKAALPKLRALLEDVDGSAEDCVYRFYHQSLKVYWLQGETKRIVRALQRLAPERTLNEWFTQIVKAGTDREFAMDDNKRWLEVTRPMIEAFAHARYFLAMAVKYGSDLDAPPTLLPSGWAAILYLYDLR